MHSLVRWSPTRNRLSFNNEVDRLIESFFEAPRTIQPSHHPLPLDVAESAEGYTIVASIPGVKAEDLDILVEDGVLTIKAKAESRSERVVKDKLPTESEETIANSDATKGSVRYLLRERRTGKWQRSISLPKDVDIEEIDAVHADGVLTLSLPKSDGAKPKRIEVR